MAEQFYNQGDVRELDGRQFECVSVSYQETPEGERHSFTYGFRLKSELDAEREAAEAAQEAESTEVAEEPSQPQVNEEETINVR